MSGNDPNSENIQQGQNNRLGEDKIIYFYKLIRHK